MLTHRLVLLVSLAVGTCLVQACGETSSTRVRSPAKPATGGEHPSSAPTPGPIMEPGLPASPGQAFPTPSLAPAPALGPTPGMPPASTTPSPTTGGAMNFKESIGTKTVRFKHIASDKCILAYGGAGVPIGRDTCRSERDQKFNIAANGDQTFRIGLTNNLCFALFEAKSSSSPPVAIVPKTCGTSNEQKFTPALLSEDTLRIKTAFGQCLGFEVINDKGVLVQAPCTDDDAQKFTLILE